jgi:hypothetical protein
MYLHKAFGLIIESPFDLPAETLYELAPGQQVDVTIECQTFLDARRNHHSQDCTVSTAPGVIVLRWEDVGEFHLYGGRQVVIHARPGVSTDILNLFITGSVFAMLLYQRGMTVLHGSVVALEDQAVAFVAPKGLGKSSLALAMQGVGATLISDDIVALPTTTPVPKVTTGFAQAKLWPDSLTHLGYAPDQHTKLREEVEKRGVVLNLSEQTQLPLRHIFILGRSDTLTLLPFNQNHALLTLLPHWYLARYGTATVQQLGATARHFSQCLALVQNVQVSALVRPDALAELPRVAAAVRDYVLTGKLPAAYISATPSPLLAGIDA